MRNVKAERLRRGWTQTDLGARARLAASVISQIESGRFRPYPGQLKRLARVLNLPAEQLLEIADEAAERE